jgi:hypothetical protein
LREIERKLKSNLRILKNLYIILIILGRATKLVPPGSTSEQSLSKFKDILRSEKWKHKQLLKKQRKSH